MPDENPGARKPISALRAMILFGSLLLLCGAAEAPGESKWISYVEPSLISDIVLHDGKLFAASHGGILIYDLLDSTFQQFSNVDGLPSNKITALTFDRSGDLYIGTGDAGIARVRFTAGGLKVGTMSALFHGLTDDRITTIAAWGDTIVYGTENGAGIIMQGIPLMRFFERDGLPDDRVSEIFADGDRVWIATDSGVVALDRLGVFHDFTGILPADRVYAFERADTALYVGTAQGVGRFNPADSTWASIGPSNAPVYSLFFDGSKIWAGNVRYLYSYDGLVWSDSVDVYPIYRRHELNWVHCEIRSIIRAPDGNLYMGVAEPLYEGRGAGLVVTDGQAIWNIMPNSLPANDIRRLDFDVDGSLWVSSSRFGVGKLVQGRLWVNYNSTTPGGQYLSYRFNNLALLADSDGIKWICTAWTYPLDELWDGLDEDFDNDVWVHHEVGSGGGDGLGSVQFLRAREDPVGNRWFLADDYPNPAWEGMHILSRDKSEWLQVTPSTTGGDMIGGRILDVAFSPGGVVYVGIIGQGVQAWATGGYDWPSLSEFDGDSWTTVGLVEREFASEAMITSLALRSDHTLWIGTTAGLYKYPGFRHIEADRGFGVGLLGVQVLDLLLDREENLWVATDKGLNRIARDDDDDIASFTTPAVWQNELNLFLPQSAVSPLVNAVCEALALHPEEDILYIGTRGGLSAFDIRPEEPPETDLSRIYLYPNPVLGRKGHSDLKIANITSPVHAEIYNVEGELVHSQEIVDPDDPVVWDLTTAQGFLAASGVYFVRITSGSRAVVKTVSLIR